eukprot:sb/3463953/
MCDEDVILPNQIPTPLTSPEPILDQETPTRSDNNNLIPPPTPLISPEPDHSEDTQHSESEELPIMEQLPSSPSETPDPSDLSSTSSFSSLDHHPGPVSIINPCSTTRTLGQSSWCRDSDPVGDYTRVLVLQERSTSSTSTYSGICVSDADSERSTTSTPEPPTSDVIDRRFYEGAAANASTETLTNQGPDVQRLPPRPGRRRSSGPHRSSRGILLGQLGRPTSPPPAYMIRPVESHGFVSAAGSIGFSSGSLVGSNCSATPLLVIDTDVVVPEDTRPPPYTEGPDFVAPPPAPRYSQVVNSCYIRSNSLFHRNTAFSCMGSVRTLAIGITMCCCGVVFLMVTYVFGAVSNTYLGYLGILQVIVGLTLILLVTIYNSNRRDFVRFVKDHRLCSCIGTPSSSRRGSRRPNSVVMCNSLQRLIYVWRHSHLVRSYQVSMSPKSIRTPIYRLPGTPISRSKPFPPSIPVNRGPTVLSISSVHLLSCNALVPKGPVHYSPVNPERQRGVYRYICT